MPRPCYKSYLLLNIGNNNVYSIPGIPGITSIPGIPSIARIPGIMDG